MSPSTLSSRLRCMSDDLALACEHATLMDERLQAADALAHAVKFAVTETELREALEAYEKVRNK